MKTSPHRSSEREFAHSKGPSQSRLTSAATITKFFYGGAVAALAFLALSAAENLNEVVKVVSTNTVPELLGTNLSAKTFVFVGNKAARTNNTSRVWLQRNPTNNVAGIPLLPGQIISVTVATDRLRQVDWWIAVETSGDGVTCLLLQ